MEVGVAGEVIPLAVSHVEKVLNTEPSPATIPCRDMEEACAQVPLPNPSIAIHTLVPVSFYKYLLRCNQVCFNINVEKCIYISNNI